MPNSTHCVLFFFILYMQLNNNFLYGYNTLFKDIKMFDVYL